MSLRLLRDTQSLTAYWQPFSPSEHFEDNAPCLYIRPDIGLEFELSPTSDISRRPHDRYLHKSEIDTDLLAKHVNKKMFVNSRKTSS